LLAEERRHLVLLLLLLQLGLQLTDCDVALQRSLRRGAWILSSSFISCFDVV
jgi:hypothetical protein